MSGLGKIWNVAIVLAASVGLSSMWLVNGWAGAILTGTYVAVMQYRAAYWKREWEALHAERVHITIRRIQGAARMAGIQDRPERTVPCGAPYPCNPVGPECCQRGASDGAG